MNGSTEVQGNTEQAAEWPWMADWNYDKGLNTNRIIWTMTRDWRQTESFDCQMCSTNVIAKNFHRHELSWKAEKTLAISIGVNQPGRLRKLIALWQPPKHQRTHEYQWNGQGHICPEHIILHDRTGQSMSRESHITYLHTSEGSALTVDLKPLMAWPCDDYIQAAMQTDITATTAFTFQTCSDTLWYNPYYQMLTRVYLDDIEDDDIKDDDNPGAFNGDASLIPILHEMGTLRWAHL